MKTLCPECSDTSMNHFLTKMDVVCDVSVNFLTRPFSKFFDTLSHGVTFSTVFPHAIRRLFRVFKFLKIGDIVEDIQGTDSMRTELMWIAARERGIQVKQLKVFGNFLNVFLADYKGKPFIFEALPRPLGSRRLDWIDDKAHIKKLFRENGIPVAKGGSYFSYQKALETFKSLRKPVIIKPTFGSRSRHTTIHIETETEFARAFKIAKEISPLVIVEEELQGPVWRVSLIGGKVAGVLRRDPPIVVGDGTKTIEELIALENKNPKRGKVFHEIPLDTFVEKELLYKGLTLTSIPAKGEKIILHPKVGRSQGGTNSHVDNIHRDNIELFEKMARVVGDPLIGVDFITSHMGKSWKEQELCGAIECNSVPFLDLHHVPYEGEPVDTMGKLWDVVLLSL